MKRQLLAALAGCLVLPLAGWAQSDGSTIPNAPLYPTARPVRAPAITPARPAPTTGLQTPRPASPYNLQTIRPITPTPVQVPEPEYPTQKVGSNPVLLPTDLVPESTSTNPEPGTPQWSAAPAASFGQPIPQSSTSFKNPTEVVLPQTTLTETPPTPRMVLGSPVYTEPAPPSSTPPLPTYSAEPRGRTPRMTGTPTGPQMSTSPGTPAMAPATPSAVTPVPSAPTYQSMPAYPQAPNGAGGTLAEQIIRNPAGSCANGQCATPTAVCTTCQPCGPYGRVWVSAEYLYWQAKGANAPPLVTMSPAGTPVSQAGVLGTPGVSILSGGNSINNDWRSGFRVRGGLWLNDDQTLGLDGGGFWLGRNHERMSFGGDGSPIVSRPFFNPLNMAQASELVSFPGIVSGTTTVDSTSSIYGGDANIRKNLACGPCSRLDVLFGYRYLRMTDRVSITENLIATDPTNARAPIGTQISVMDTFDSSNTFNGGQIGLSGERRFGRLYLGGTVKVALGNTHSVVNINGATRITTPAPNSTTTSLVGGLLAQPSNIGSYATDRFSVVPEVGLNLGVQLTQNLRLFGGYSFLYWNNVSRAAEQIDYQVNPSQIPRQVPPSALQGTPRPLFPNRENDYWLHGLNVGLELRF